MIAVESFSNIIETESYSNITETVVFCSKGLRLERKESKFYQNVQQVPLTHVRIKCQVSVVPGRFIW